MRSPWLLLSAGAYALALALIGLWSTPVDRNIAVMEFGPFRWATGLLGLDLYEGYRVVEFSANVVLFIPLGVLVLLWWRRWGWWGATLVAFATTVAIEVLQEVLRPERFASIGDVVANTIGGTIGGLLVVAARRQAGRARAGRTKEQGSW